MAERGKAYVYGADSAHEAQEHERCGNVFVHDGQPDNSTSDMPE